jgi:Leucine-rich repeat (LRR) protein
MNLDLLREYYHFRYGKDFELTSPFILSFQEELKDDFHQAFIIDQQLVDYNINFLKLLPFSGFRGLVIQGVKEIDWEKIKGFEIFKKISRIRFFDSKVDGFFKLSDQMIQVKHIEINGYENLIEQNVDYEIGNLKGIESLSIYAQNVLHLPESIIELKSLKKLNLHCKFSFEKKINNISSLETLSIDNINAGLNISDLLYSINNLSNLKHLHYQDTHTSECPDFSAIMPKLNSFSLTMFKKKNLPQFIEKGKNLQTLSISLDFKTIPEWVNKLSKLEILRISDPFINGKLPTVLNKMSNLKIIDFSNCMDLIMDAKKSKNIIERFPSIDIYPLKEISEAN